MCWNTTAPAPLNGLSFTDTSYTHRTLTDSVDQYIQAFMSALVPGG